jgi:hypothetical protein
MRTVKRIAVIATWLLIVLFLAPQAGGKLADPASAAAAALAHLLRDNEAIARSHDERHFAAFRDEQHPPVTLVACADSRFQTDDIDKEDDGDLFVVRNIGNQIDNNAGSVRYGIHHLGTPQERSAAAKSRL